MVCLHICGEGLKKLTVRIGIVKSLSINHLVAWGTLILICVVLNLAVLDFTKQLVGTGEENDFVLALIVFSLQYVLVNHEYWKYKVKHVRWKVTLKVHICYPLILQICS